MISIKARVTRRGAGSLHQERMISHRALTMMLLVLDCCTRSYDARQYMVHEYAL